MEWGYLVEKAIKAKENAYVPYSEFRVGAVVLTDSGKVFVGCNVENASYGAAICAERTAVVKAVSEGDTIIKAIAITSDSEDYTFPCGICRQVIAEFCDEETQVICSNKDGKYVKYFVKDILPHAFTKKNLL